MKQKEVLSERELRIRFAKHLRAMRKSRRLSQTKFAAKMGLQQSALSRIEKGKQSLKIEQYLLLFIDSEF